MSQDISDEMDSVMKAGGKLLSSNPAAFAAVGVALLLGGALAYTMVTRSKNVKVKVGGVEFEADFYPS
ncbi:hypothetical protein CRENPOLYSF2_1390017 [Crenothrix polyspora]|uniref:Uncharacterized protein n=1 Tax=Crenothrix polyspora TaxID=360316 RepID=A0A1R4H0Y6_9GAMM|nr:hypothetical protein [Crenothrix polyspora]SJM89907.1 hypothetical protein CRENPOLYSF2_1390017 [Crenothrix polyspora]